MPQRLGSTLELRGTAGMGTASMAEMADRVLGIHGEMEVVVPTGRVGHSGAPTSASIAVEQVLDGMPKW